ncbi:MAG: hypothetical protein ACREGR_01910 [Minisyncoccia bacterium]
MRKLSFFVAGLAFCCISFYLSPVQAAEQCIMFNGLKTCGEAVDPSAAPVPVVPTPTPLNGAIGTVQYQNGIPFAWYYCRPGIFGCVSGWWSIPPYGYEPCCYSSQPTFGIELRFGGHHRHW